MISSFSRLVGSCLMAAVFCLACESRAAGDLKTALAAVRVPGSDLELVANAAQSQNTPFNQKVKEMKQQFEQEMDAESLAMGKEIEAVMKSIGIEEDSVNYVLASISLRSLDPQAETPKIPGLLAIAVKSPLSAGAIIKNVTEYAAGKGAPVQLKESTYKEVPVISVVFDMANLPENIDEEAATFLSDLNLALPADGSVIYIGQSAQVQAGIDRMLGGDFGARSDGLQAAKALVPEKADSYVIFDMPDSFRQMLSGQAQMAAQNGGGNPMIGPMQALAGLKGAAFSSITTDKAAMALAGDFESPENAMQIKAVLDMGIGMLKMQLMNMTAGQPMPVLESIKTSNEGTKATLAFDITVQDIQSFMAFATRMKAQAANPAGAPGVAPGMGAPGGVPAP